MKNPNFLIMAEPTTDLDTVTLQVLEAFLPEFSGCVLLVSHDRHFVDRLSDHTFVFEGEGEVKDFPGGYTDYRNWKELQPQPEKREKNKEPVEKDPDTKSAKLSYKLRLELETLESEI